MTFPPFVLENLALRQQLAIESRFRSET